MRAAEESPIFCDRCREKLRRGAGAFYVVKIEAFADPSSPVFPGDEDAADVGRRIDALVQQLAAFSEQELMDQVYRRVFLHLCPACYRTWIENPVSD